MCHKTREPKYKEVCKDIAKDVHKILNEEIEQVLMNSCADDLQFIQDKINNAVYYSLGRRCRGDDDDEWFKERGRIHRLIHSMMGA
jgi:hypothetical protein